MITAKSILDAAVQNGQNPEHGDEDVQFLVMECGVPLNQLEALVVSGVDLEDLASRMAGAGEGETLQTIIKDMTGKEMQHDTVQPPAPNADLIAELERMREENARLRNRAKQRLSCKVSEKGAISVYGVGRFPVTLYLEQMEKFLDFGPEIRTFISENRSRLKTKE